MGYKSGFGRKNADIETVWWCLSAEESSLWPSLVLGSVPNKLQAQSEERVLKCIWLNSEENIDDPITGESGMAWRDGGRPKLRSISEVGEGKKRGKKAQKHRHTGREERYSPKQMWWSVGWKNKTHPASTFQNKGLYFFHRVFFLCFAESLIVPPPLTTRYSAPCTRASRRRVASAFIAAQHLNPGRSHNRDSLLFWAKRDVVQQWTWTHSNILWQQRLFSVTNKAPWPRKSNELTSFTSY